RGSAAPCCVAHAVRNSWGESRASDADPQNRAWTSRSWVLLPLAQRIVSRRSTSTATPAGSETHLAGAYATRHEAWLWQRGPCPRNLRGVRDEPAWIEGPAHRKRRRAEEQRPAGPQLYVAAMMTWSAPGQPVCNPGGLAHSVAVLLEVVDREVLALRRVRKGSVAELLDDWHELVLSEAVECLSG